jgi:hypothetical protein
MAAVDSQKAKYSTMPVITRLKDPTKDLSYRFWIDVILILAQSY